MCADEISTENAAIPASFQAFHQPLAPWQPRTPTTRKRLHAAWPPARPVAVRAARQERAHEAAQRAYRISGSPPRGSDVAPAGWLFRLWSREVFEVPSSLWGEHDRKLTHHPRESWLLGSCWREFSAAGRRNMGTRQRHHNRATLSHTGASLPAGPRRGAHNATSHESEAAHLFPARPPINCLRAKNQIALLQATVGSSKSRSAGAAPSD